MSGRGYRRLVSPAEHTLTPDERAAARAFLQRSEVRLSTLHRIVTALLSGAGVLVLLPALGRDAIVGVMRSLLTADGTAMHRLIAGIVAVTLALVLIVVWMLLVEITRPTSTGPVPCSVSSVPVIVTSSLRSPRSSTAWPATHCGSR